MRKVKKCPKCGEFKEFNRSYCRPCYSQWQKENRKKRRKNKDHVNKTQQYSRNYYQSTKNNIDASLKRKLYAAKQRTKKKNLEFNLDIDYLKNLFLKTKGNCVVSGKKLIIGAGLREPDSLSIDRIDSKKGYIKGNIRFVTFAINVAIQNWGLDEFYILCEDVINYQEKKCYSKKKIKSI